MAVYSFDDKRPQIGKGSYIHPTADVIGDVRLGENTFVGAGAVVRGDYGTIIVGDNCSIEENCTIHARPGEVCTLGDWVTVATRPSYTMQKRSATTPCWGWGR